MSRLTRIRVPEYLFTVWVIVTLNFALPRVMPGDPFVYLSADQGDEVARFSEAQQTYYRDQYGLDRPLAAQYASYLGALLRGDLGYSIYYNQGVTPLLLNRLPWTLLLVTASVVFSTLAGCLFGSLSAYRRGRATDRWLYPAMIAVSEIPAFLLGLILLFTLAAGPRLFPLSGAMTHFAVYSTVWERVADIARHAALPIITLSIVRTGGMYLLVRNSMTTVLARDYVRTARAKGLFPARILVRHTLRNAMPPIVTRLFLSLGGLVGGAILVENVFAYPGLGRLMREAVLVHDYPLIQGVFLLVTLTVLFANALADLLYGRLDPRIREKAVAAA